MTTAWQDMADRVLAGGRLERGEALAVATALDDELLAVLDAAFRVRLRHHGRAVNLHLLHNARSGLCSEQCSFCSQSASSTAPIPHYPMQDPAQIVEGAREAARCGAVKYCVVTSGRKPSAADIATIVEAAGRIKREFPLKLCVSLGLLSPAQARELRAAGVDRYNHNLETSRRFFPSICTTHGFDDRVATVRAARAAGLEACCGGIVGLGETPEDRVDLAFTLRELEVEAIPVNFFNPRPGTPLEGRAPLPAAECLRTLAMFRLVNPAADLRAAGGREACLGAMQPLCLYAVNSIFTQGYLTTGGQGYEQDLAMLRAAGFVQGRLEA